MPKTDGVDDASPFGHIQHQKKRAFLRALVEVGGNISRACEVVEIDRSTPYTDQWKDDEEFQKAREMAEAMAGDHLEAEAIRRAYDGVKEPVGFYKGEPSAYVRKYSDTLMIFLLKGTKPEKYVDRHRLEHSGKIEGGVLMVPQVDEDEWDELARRRQAVISENGHGVNGDGSG